MKMREPAALWAVLRKSYNVVRREHEWTHWGAFEARADARVFARGESSTSGGEYRIRKFVPAPR